MRALLEEAALAEDADLRRGPDRRQPVRDHQRRARRRGHRSLSRAACTTCSDFASSADVASSKMSKRGSLTIARAIATRCF